MVRFRGAGPEEAERIAACWADNRKVTQVAFKSGWTRGKNAAPFKTNDVTLDTRAIGVIVFIENLADKAQSSLVAPPLGAFSSAETVQDTHRQN